MAANCHLNYRTPRGTGYTLPVAEIATRILLGGEYTDYSLMKVEALRILLENRIFCFTEKLFIASLSHLLDTPL